MKECQTELLGTGSESIRQAEDRELFKELCEKLGEPVLPSLVANTAEEALQAAKTIGYPVVLRPAFTLGGTGGGFADDEQEFLGLIHNALALSPVHQVLVEKALKVLKKLNMKSFVILMIRQLRCATWKSGSGRNPYRRFDRSLPIPNLDE